MRHSEPQAQLEPLAQRELLAQREPQAQLEPEAQTSKRKASVEAELLDSTPLIFTQPDDQNHFIVENFDVWAAFYEMQRPICTNK